MLLRLKAQLMRLQAHYVLENYPNALGTEGMTMDEAFQKLDGLFTEEEISAFVDYCFAAEEARLDGPVAALTEEVSLFDAINVLGGRTKSTSKQVEQNKEVVFSSDGRLTALWSRVLFRRDPKTVEERMNRKRFPVYRTLDDSPHNVYDTPEIALEYAEHFADSNADLRGGKTVVKPEDVYKVWTSFIITLRFDQGFSFHFDCCDEETRSLQEDMGETVTSLEGALEPAVMDAFKSLYEYEKPKKQTPTERRLGIPAAVTPPATVAAREMRKLLKPAEWLKSGLWEKSGEPNKYVFTAPPPWEIAEGFDDEDFDDEDFDDEGEDLANSEALKRRWVTKALKEFPVGCRVVVIHVDPDTGISEEYLGMEGTVIGHEVSYEYSELPSYTVQFDDGDKELFFDGDIERVKTRTNPRRYSRRR